MGLRCHGRDFTAGLISDADEGVCRRDGRGGGMLVEMGPVAWDREGEGLREECRRQDRPVRRLPNPFSPREGHVGQNGEIVQISAGRARG